MLRSPEPLITPVNLSAVMFAFILPEPLRVVVNSPLVNAPDTIMLPLPLHMQ